MTHAIVRASRTEKPAMRLSNRAAFTLAATALVLSGCPVLPTENLDLPSGRQVGSISIDPANVSLSIGGTKTFTGTALDTSGVAIPSATFTWTLSNGDVAEFVGEAKGKSVEVKAKAFGSTSLTASYGSREFVATVVVSSDVGSITLSGPSEVVLGDKIAFSAEVFDLNGNPTTRDVLLVPANNMVFTPVDGEPLKLGAYGVGQVAVQARVDDVWSNAIVVTAKPESIEWRPKSLVFPAGSSGTLDLDIKGRNGVAPRTTLTGLTVTTDGPFTATVLGPDSVQVASEVGGTGSITGNLFGVTATASVRAVAVASIEITGSTENLVAGESRTFSAVAKDDRGGVIDGATFTWFAGNEFGAGPGALDGTATGATFTPTVHAIGRGSVWATAGGVSDAVHLVVVPASLDLEVNRTFVAVGESLIVRGTPRTTDGDALTTVMSKEGESDYGWSLSGASFGFAGTPGAVDTTVVAGAKGTAGLSLTLFGVQSNTLSLTAAEVLDVTIAADTSPLAAGDVRDFSATVTTDPEPPVGTSFQVWWEDGAGLLFGGEAGEVVSLSARTLGLSSLVAKVGSGAAAVTSDPFVVAIVPADGFIPVVSVAAGETNEISATARTRTLNPLTGSNFKGSWTWEVEDEAIATITQTGDTALLHGHKGGTTNVTATWQPPDDHPAWTGADVKATGSITVAASAAPVDGAGDFLANWIGFAEYDLSFPQATDVGTPQDELQYEIYASKSSDPFTDEGTLVTTISAPAEAGVPVTLSIDVTADVPSEMQSPHPGWSFGVRAIDGEGQASQGKVFSLKRHENPVLGTAAVFGAAGRLGYVGPASFGFLGDVATESSAIEWTAGSLAHDGALVGIGNFGGQQHLFRRPAGSTDDLSTLSLGVIATETTPGACSAVSPRPVTAFGARATFDEVPNTDVVVYTATEGRLSCDEAVLVMRHAENGREELLASSVTAVAGWDTKVWYVARVLGVSAFGVIDLATGVHSAVDELADPPADTLLTVWNGAPFLLVPSAKLLVTLSGDEIVMETHDDFGDARAFSIIDGEILIEQTNGDLFITPFELDGTDLVLGGSFTLSSAESLGGERFVLGSSR